MRCDQHEPTVDRDDDTIEAREAQIAGLECGRDGAAVQAALRASMVAY